MHTKGVHNSSIPITKDMVDRKKVRKAYHRRFYYSFFTIFLIICLFQVLRSEYLNVVRYITLHRQLSKLEELNTTAKEKNLYLQRQLKDFTSSKGIEALARNNLKMAGKDEVLVIIKEPVKKQ